MISSTPSYWLAEHKILIVDTIAYIAAAKTGLQVVNLADPSRPLQIGCASGDFRALDVLISWNLAYVAGDSGGIQVVDVTNPKRPTVLSSARVTRPSQAGYRHSGNDPRHPVEANPSSIIGAAKAIALHGQRAIVASGSEGVTIFDVTNPFHPSQISFVDIPGNAQEIAVRDSYAYIVAQSEGLRVIDISNPLHPIEVGYWNTPGTAKSLTFYQDYLLVADGTAGLQVVDVSDPANPIGVGSCDTPGSALDVAVTENTAYVADSTHWFQIIDLSNPTSPQLIRSYEQLRPVNSVATKDSLLVVGNRGLSMMDVTLTTSPVPLCDWEKWWATAYRANVINDHIFVADGGRGVRIIDMSVSGQLADVGYCDLPYSVRDVEPVGDYAYVACDHVAVINITDLSRPHIEGYCFFENVAYDQLAMWGTRAFCSNGHPHWPLSILDCSNPQSPFVWTNYYIDDVTDVDIVGTRAYFVNLLGGFHIMRDLDVGPPFPHSITDLNATLEGLDVLGSLAAIVSAEGLLILVDVGDPSTPSVLSETSLPTSAWDVILSRGRAFVANGTSGIRVFDVLDPTSPSEIGFYDTPGFAYDIAVAGDQIVVVDADYIELLQFDPSASIGNTSPLPMEISLLPPYPNPFNPLTNVEYSVSAHSNVQLTIHNLLGQFVTTLVDERQTAGPHRVLFDATGYTSGAYVIRLQVNDQIMTRKAILLR